MTTKRWVLAYERVAASSCGNRAVVPVGFLLITLTIARGLNWRAGKRHAN